MPDISVAADDALERALAEARPAAEAFAAARLEHRLAQARLVAKGLETAREQLAAGEGAVASATLDATVRGGLDAGVLDEQEVNMLGYEFLGEGQTGAAVAVLRVNTDTFPESANTWDSLGEAYAEDGQVEPAIESYRRSLELDPRNENARRRIEALGGSD